MLRDERNQIPPIVKTAGIFNKILTAFFMHCHYSRNKPVDKLAAEALNPLHKLTETLPSINPAAAETGLRNPPFITAY
jgi:hypothetical protein